MSSSSSKSHSSLYNIPLLTMDNFPTWKFKVESVLQDRGLWSCVVPVSSSSSTPSAAPTADQVKEAKPSSTPPPTVTTAPTAEQEQKALTQIRLTISDDLIPLVRPCKTAKEAWEAICDQFEHKGITSRVSLKRQLFNIKWVDTVPMQAHINTIRALALQLETVGSAVSDEDLAVVLLCSLDHRFDALVVQMEGRPASDITFSFVSGRLLAERNRQVIQGPPTPVYTDTSAGASAFLARGRPARKMFCTYCNRTGHVEEKCWDKEDGIDPDAPIVSYDRRSRRK